MNNQRTGQATQTAATPVETARRSLEAHGYRVGVREQGFCEALVVRAEERWLGRGLTVAEALEDALTQMLPSRLARELWLSANANHALGAADTLGAVAAHAPAGAAVGAPSLAHADTPGGAPSPAPAAPPASAPAAVASPVTTPARLLVPMASHAAAAAAATAAAATAAAATAAAATAAAAAPVAATGPAAATATAPVEATGPAPATAPGTATAPTATTATATATTAPPAAAAAATATAPAAAKTTATAPAAVTTPAPAAPVARPAPVAAPRPADPARGASLAQLATLQAQLVRDLPRLARLSPTLLRLEMLALICRARAFTDQYAADVVVEKAVGDVARDLTELGKRWWPGSVRALQLRATPNDVARELGLRPGVTVPSWSKAAEFAQSELLAQRGRPGVNAEGWSDDAECDPGPEDPITLLREAQAAFDAKHATEAALLDQARRLRWLRPHLPPEEWAAWADAVGALRCHADRNHLATLQGLLDPSFRPRGDWRREVGQDPVARDRKKRRAKHMRNLPRDGASRDAVARWLAEAFELGDALPNPKIAANMGHLKALIATLGDDDLPQGDRRHRRRLQSLQELLASGRLTDDGELDEGDGEGVDDDEAEVEVEVDDLLTAQVRGKVSGQRALLLSNRADPELERRLLASLGLEVTLSLVDTRRRQAAAQAVDSGTYNLVLAAHRFIGHDVDKDIGQRARAGGIPYVRVGSGRVASVVRALARELGM